MMDAKFFGPLAYGFGFPIVCDKNIVGLIVVLFKFACPAAIFRGVITVIIDSINRLSFRSVPHISVEILKFTPLLANGYTPADVYVCVAR